MTFGGSSPCLPMSRCAGCFEGVGGPPLTAQPGSRIHLNDHEIHSLNLASLGTATLYQGDCPESSLRKKVAEVVHANSWLAGHLQRLPSTGKLVLCVGENIDCEGFLEIKAVERDLLHVLGKQTPGVWVKSGPALVKESEPVCRIVALTSNGWWGLLMSMSHVVGDGHTFYTIHNMLDKDAEVWPMELKRVDFNPLRCLKAPLHGKWPFWILQQYFINPLRNSLARRMFAKESRLSYRVRYVRDEWLQEQKMSFATEAGAPFVSSNDLLASWFFCATKPACGAIVYNMRGRMEGLAAKHAGTYSTLLIFFPEEYNSPANIRRAVSGKSPACTRDGLLQSPGKGGRCGLVTAFHDLCHAVKFDGCTQSTHLPSGAEPLDLSMVLPPIAAIFRPLPNRLAMWTITEDELPAGPLGDKVFGADESE